MLDHQETFYSLCRVFSFYSGNDNFIPELMICIDIIKKQINSFIRVQCVMYLYAYARDKNGWIFIFSHKM